MGESKSNNLNGPKHSQNLRSIAKCELKLLAFFKSLSSWREMWNRKLDCHGETSKVQRIYPVKNSMVKPPFFWHTDNIVSATALLLEVDIQHGQFESISNCFLEHRCSAFFPSKSSNHLRYDNYVKNVKSIFYDNFWASTPLLILLPVLVVPHESLPNFEDFLPHFLQPLWVVQVALENLPGLKEMPGNTKGFLKSKGNPLVFCLSWYWKSLDITWYHLICLEICSQWKVHLEDWSHFEFQDIQMMSWSGPPCEHLCLQWRLKSLSSRRNKTRAGDTWIRC